MKAAVVQDPGGGRQRGHSPVGAPINTEMTQMRPGTRWNFR